MRGGRARRRRRAPGRRRRGSRDPQLRLGLRGGGWSAAARSRWWGWVGVGAREAVEVEVEVEAPWDWDASSSTYCRLQPFSSLSFNSSPLFFFLFTPSSVLFYVVSRVFTAQAWVFGHFCLYLLLARCGGCGDRFWCC
jgi:hypothetical protein